MKVFFSCLFLCFLLSAGAQNKIIFYKNDSSKTITISSKDLLRISYNGYSKQPQETEGMVAQITDSNITISPKKRFFKRKLPLQDVYLKDITGFKKYAKFRPAAEIIYGVVSVGITGAISAIISKANVSPALNFVAAAGTSAVTGVMKNVFFSSKIKNYIGKDWSYKLQ